MQYRAHIEGFTGHFNTVDALKDWAEDLNRRFALTGKTLLVWKAVAITGNCAQYNAIPTRELVVGA